MKLLILNIILVLLLSACKRDIDYLENRYFSRQMQEDIEQNREELYNQSYVGVLNEIPKKR